MSLTTIKNIGFSLLWLFVMFCIYAVCNQNNNRLYNIECLNTDNETIKYTNIKDIHFGTNFIQIKYQGKNLTLYNIPCQIQRIQ